MTCATPLRRAPTRAGHMRRKRFVLMLVRARCPGAVGRGTEGRDPAGGSGEDLGAAMEEGVLR